MASSMSLVSNVNGVLWCNKQSFGEVQRKKRMVVVRAEGINPAIRKEEDKVVESVVVSELSKNLTAYCRVPRLLINDIDASYIMTFLLNTGPYTYMIDEAGRI